MLFIYYTLRYLAGKIYFVNIFSDFFLQGAKYPIGLTLIQPSFLTDNLKGVNYVEFLQNDLPTLQKEVLDSLVYGQAKDLVYIKEFTEKLN